MPLPEPQEALVTVDDVLESLEDESIRRSLTPYLTSLHKVF